VLGAGAGTASLAARQRAVRRGGLLAFILWEARSGRPLRRTVWLKVWPVLAGFLLSNAPVAADARAQVAAGRPEPAHLRGMVKNLCEVIFAKAEFMESTLRGGNPSAAFFYAQVVLLLSFNLAGAPRLAQARSGPVRGVFLRRCCRIPLNQAGDHDLWSRGFRAGALPGGLLGAGFAVLGAALECDRARRAAARVPGGARRTLIVQGLGAPLEMGALAARIGAMDHTSITPARKRSLSPPRCQPLRF